MGQFKKSKKTNPLKHNYQKTYESSTRGIVYMPMFSQVRISCKSGNNLQIGNNRSELTKRNHRPAPTLLTRGFFKREREKERESLIKLHHLHVRSPITSHNTDLHKRMEQLAVKDAHVRASRAKKLHLKYSEIVLIQSMIYSEFPNRALFDFS